MKNYHYNIILPVTFVSYQPTFRSFREIPIDKQLINNELILWLNSLGITIYSGRFFNSRPHQTYNVHFDGAGDQNTVKINLIFDSTDSIMNWYEALPGYNGKIYKNTIGDPVLHYEQNKCKLVHTIPVNTHCLLDGGVLHDLQNGFNNGQFRKCYSLTLSDFKTNKRLKWSEAVEILKPFLIE